MSDPFGTELAKERQRELLREAEERRTAGALRRFRRSAGEGKRGGQVELEGVEVRWGLAEDEGAVAELLELNGMPRWVSYEERFIVAQRDGKVLGAVRYRTESKRLILGLLVVDPWAGEKRLASALYAGAADLARELGVGEVVASAARTGYPGSAGYRRRGRDWRMDIVPTLDACGEVAKDGWRRVLSMFGELPVPFHGHR
jgi:Acetyltransferase (GNAT) family